MGIEIMVHCTNFVGRYCMSRTGKQNFLRRCTNMQIRLCIPFSNKDFTSTSPSVSHRH